ncbi:hypothetical protein [Candidatus Francisella endociliophora]|nr:hypothetical protein [Francisella sp. FSC1006]
MNKKIKNIIECLVIMALCLGLSSDSINIDADINVHATYVA